MDARGGDPTGIDESSVRNDKCDRRFVIRGRRRDLRQQAVHRCSQASGFGGIEPAGAFGRPHAAAAYRRLVEQRGHVRRVVILGPAHFARRIDAAVPEWSAFATPLGEIEVDQSGCALAAGLPAVTFSAGAHAREHSIEVQLPFLQRSLGADISIVPIAVGRVEMRPLADVISALWTDESTAVVVSTDLSHYQDQATAEQLDGRTAEAILRQDPLAIGEGAACGRYPLRALLEVTRERSLRMRQLDLRTSADTTGDRSNVVGYGAFAAYAHG